MEKRSNQLIPLEVIAERKGNEVHPSASVAPSVRLGKRVKIGPYCSISGDVEIGDGATILQNSIVEGCVRIGKNGIIHPFCIIGNLSHDLKFPDSEKASVAIGDDCVVREFTNLHAGTPAGGGSRIGNDVYIMSHSHVGHDCELGDGCLLSQQTTLGGEVKIDIGAIIGGCSAVHQFCTIGKYAIIGGCSKITQDVIPYSMSDGNPQELSGLNLVGLKRNGFSEAEIRIIKEVYKTLFMSEEGLWAERLDNAKRVYAGNPVADEIFDFIAKARRIIAKPRGRRAQEA